MLKDEQLGIDFPPMLPNIYSKKDDDQAKAILEPTKQYTKCGCNGTLQKRPDDKKEVVENRINMYRKESPPLLKHYNNKRVVAIPHYLHCIHVQFKTLEVVQVM